MSKERFVIENNGGTKRDLWILGALCFTICCALVLVLSFLG